MSVWPEETFARRHEEYTHKNRKIQVANLGLYVIALVVFDAFRAK
jgi:hypothetical protein